MTSASRSLLVIGYGNPGRLDDGLGPAFADRVEQLRLPGVTVESNYQLTVEDAALIAGHDLVLFVDAALYCQEKFLVKRVEPEIDASFCTHSVSPGQVYHLALSLFSADTRAYILGIRGYEFNAFGERLSDRARENLEAALALFQSMAEQNWNFESIAAPGDFSASEHAPLQGEEKDE